ncbi:MAG TPA: DnaJ domain-containing protein [Hyphomicrobiaceae bacterium]|jgi:hypothetical protein|nr:DnaJ domain-containing protein [Hyphomicrobiaceae bacterium]
MQFLILGLAALLLLLVASRGFAVANTQLLARRLQVGAGIAVMAGALFLVLRGAIGYATSLAALGSWLIWGAGGLSWPGGQTRKTPGNTSSVATEHLQVELDHDTGAIRGEVLKGAFAGRALDSLTPAETARLWQDCRFADPQSAKILEAYLDRVHPSWRDDLARAQGAGAQGADARMTREEAYEVLGLAAGAGEDDIRRAHRELMMKLHPDRGGSNFLAAKINEAKDVLLNGRA